MKKGDLCATDSYKPILIDVYTRSTNSTHLRDRFNPWEQYGDEDFRMCFRPRKDSLSKGPHKNFGWRSSKENARELLAINLVYLYLLHAQPRHSQGFKGYCKTKRIIPVIPRQPGWYQEKVLRCYTLFFTSLFTFYDIVHFSQLCKSYSFFDWSFNRLQRPWSWLMSRLILLGFRKLNKLQFPLMLLPFFPTFPVISYTVFAFLFKKVSTQFS